MLATETRLGVTFWPSLRVSLFPISAAQRSAAQSNTHFPFVTLVGEAFMVVAVSLLPLLWLLLFVVEVVAKCGVHNRTAPRGR